MGDEADLVKAGAQGITEGAMKPVSDLVQSLFGPAAEEAGLMLKDHVRVYRAARQARLYIRTAAIFERLGVRPKQVPLKLLFPIIENASVEDTDELQDRWANLLAHAANPNERDTVNPSFPTILRELTPRQARFLDAVYDEALQRLEKRYSNEITGLNFGFSDLAFVFSNADLAQYPMSHGYVTAAESNRDDVRADHEEISVALDVFIRHRILEERYEIPKRESRWGPELDSSIQFTYLGAQFVAACREPKPKADVVIEVPE
jgi:hypothetical protein